MTADYINPELLEPLVQALEKRLWADKFLFWQNVLICESIEEKEWNVSWKTEGRKEGRMREKWDSRGREGKRVEDMGENKEGERERGRRRVEERGGKEGER